MKDKDKSQDFNPVMDKAKAKAIAWAIKPISEQEKRTFSRIHVEAPYSISVFLHSMDFIEQCLKAEIDEGDVRKFTLDKNVRSDFAHKFAASLLEASVAVNGERAKLTIDMIKNMNRPAGNMFGMLGGLMNQSEEELEEVKYEE